MKWRKRRAAKIIGREGWGSKQKAAEVCGVSPWTISEWQKDPEFQKLMSEEAEKSLNILEESQDEIDSALCESAKLKGREGTADRKLYYQKRGQLVEKKETTLKTEEIDIDGLSDEELESERQKLLEIFTRSGEERGASED